MIKTKSLKEIMSSEDSRNGEMQSLAIYEKAGVRVGTGKGFGKSFRTIHEHE